MAKKGIFSWIGGKDKPIENIVDLEKGTTAHDIDYWNTNATNSVEYEGYLPQINGEQLNWLFPKGEMKTTSLTTNMAKRYYLIYQQIKRTQAVMVTQFEWEGLPEDIDPLCLEEKLLMNGSVAIVNVAGVYMAVLYECVKDEEDIYGRPRKIRVNEKGANRIIKDRVFEEFVIISNDGLNQGLYQSLTPEINGMIEAKIMIARNPKDSRPQGFFPTTKNNHKNVTAMVKSIANDTSPLHTIIVDDKGGELFNKDGTANKAALSGDYKGNIFIDGTLQNNANELLLVEQFWENEWKKLIGLNISGGRNSERTIQSQLATEQSLPKSYLNTRLKYRERAAKEMNKLWKNLNVTVKTFEIEDEAVEEEKETTEMNGGMKNES